MNECHTSPAWGRLCKTCLLTCLRTSRTSALCFETGKKKKAINYKRSSCVKCFTVYKGLSHAFMRSRKRNSWKIDQVIRPKIYPTFNVEKPLEERGEKGLA